MLSHHTLSGEKLNGCFTKEGWNTYSFTPKYQSHKEVDSLAACALYCSTDLDWCDGFSFLPNNPKGRSNCFPRQGARLRAQNPHGKELMIAGWCPNNKGDVYL